jgi:hypothetical protein
MFAQMRLKLLKNLGINLNQERRVKSEEKGNRYKLLPLRMSYNFRTSHFLLAMTLTLTLSPEILERLAQAAHDRGISIEDYTLQMLDRSVPQSSTTPIAPTTIDRRTLLQQMQIFRDSIEVQGESLSQTVIDARAGERY